MVSFDIESLMQVPPQTPAEADVRDWLKNSRHVFAEDNWSISEVAHLAITLGFEFDAVCSVMSHWNDALQGSRFENRAAMEEYRLLVAIDDFRAIESKRAGAETVSLGPLWLDYVNYTVEGIEFEVIGE